MTRKLILLSLALVVWFGAGRYHPNPGATSCTFTAIDVGQGDSILIQTSDHQDILIDGGPDDSVTQKLGALLPPGDRDIELMVLTHPHADHVNGLVAVSEQLTVRSALLTGVHYRQSAYEAWLEELEEQHTKKYFAIVGQEYRVGTATLTVLWPVRNLSMETIEHDDASHGGGVNDSSIVLRLECGGSAAMLMGDASSDIEERIVDSGVNVQSALLKVGHHGSRFSSSPKFLTAARPSWAVISSGTGNRYNHPHPTALLHLQKSGVAILRTDQEENVRLESDGKGGWRRLKKIGLDKSR